MERDQAMKFIYDLLRAMVAKKASDLFITAGFPPALKIDGRVTPVSNQNLTPQHTMELARSVMNDKQAEEFEEDQGVQLRGQSRASGASASTRSCSRRASAWCSGRSPPTFPSSRS